jgi:hypothetical protein
MSANVCYCSQIAITHLVLKSVFEGTLLSDDKELIPGVEGRVHNA